MYEVDDRDRSVELLDLPRMDVGAPMPVVLADEGTVVVGYLTRLEGAYVKKPCCIVEFESVEVHYFGRPNDEALEGHPLAGRGLHSYGAFEVRDSSWIRLLERRNRVHPRHIPAGILTNKHYVLTFHDSTFECVARGFSVEIWDGFQPDLPAELVRHLKH